MIKIVQQSSWDDIGYTGVDFYVPGSQLRKMASTIFGTDYENLKPDKDHVGIHLVALGDYEHYGLNKNFDGFSKKSCQDYGHTFVTDGHVFEHHENDDPAKAIGIIKHSAYNEDMGRQELFIHVNKEKGAGHLSRFEKTGSAAFSMACNVLYDVCNVCGTPRENRNDPNTCDHIKYSFGKEAADGTIIGTMNPEPKWFDISFVNKPADRIAYDLKKVARFGSDGDDFRAWTRSLESGMTVPSHVAMGENWASSKRDVLIKLSHVSKMLSDEGQLPKVDRMYLDLVKQAVVREMDKDLIEELRESTVEDVMNKLAEDDVILSPEEFFHYVFGTECNTSMRTKIALAIKRCSSILEDCEDDYVDICTNTRYDVTDKPSRPVTKKAMSHMVVTGDRLNSNILETPSVNVTKVVDKLYKYAIVPSKDIDVLAKEYVAYKVAAINTIKKNRSDVDNVRLFTSAAVQNLYRKS